MPLPDSSVALGSDCVSLYNSFYNRKKAVCEYWHGATVAPEAADIMYSEFRFNQITKTNILDLMPNCNLYFWVTKGWAVNKLKIHVTEHTLPWQQHLNTVGSFLFKEKLKPSYLIIPTGCRQNTQNASRNTININEYDGGNDGKLVHDPKV